MDKKCFFFQRQCFKNPDFRVQCECMFSWKTRANRATKRYRDCYKKKRHTHSKFFKGFGILHDFLNNCPSNESKERLHEFAWSWEKSECGWWGNSLYVSYAVHWTWRLNNVKVTMRGGVLRSSEHVKMGVSSRRVNEWTPVCVFGNCGFSLHVCEFTFAKSPDF